MRKTAIFGLTLLLVAGCATQTHPATPAPAETIPVAASEAPSNPSLPRQKSFVTSLPVRDAAERVFTALCARLSLSRGSDVDVQIGSPDATLHVYPKTWDYFSAIGTLSTAAGDVIRIDCEWIADGKTRVTLQSDLPDDRFTVVEKVASESLASTLTQ